MVMGMKKAFKILLLYPNGTLMNPPPIAIGIFTALLRAEGFELDLFDTTLYPEEGLLSDQAKEKNLQVKPFDYASRGVSVRTTRMEDDLKAKVCAFVPDLVLISMLECTYSRSLQMLTAMKDVRVPIIAGGVFPTFAPELVLKNPGITAVCVGEGERPVVELCRRLSRGEPIWDVDNLCFIRDGALVRNKLAPVIDLNTLPIPDYSLFEPERFFRPMAGKVYLTVPVETNRGCPFACTFCNSPSMVKLYRTNDCAFFRKKSIPVIAAEIEYLVKIWGAEYVYFTSDNFLIGSQAEFDQFIEFYRKIRLPFWIQSRPETVTPERIERLKSAGCHRMSMGLEHGNNDFRIKVLNKKFDNATMIKASRIIAQAGIPLTVNNMIGFPGETRELIFDTIELNRQIVSDSMNCSVFAPFHGSPLHQVCIDAGYIKDDLILGSVNTEAPLDMPQLSRAEIQGMRRTFVLYVKMPKDYWPKIKRAEILDAEGDRLFEELRSLCQRQFV